MTGAFNEAIQEIAVKHGVVLSKDDPILILQTMNERLIAETRQAQADMLRQFREEMESISSQWKDEAKAKAEKVLNVALAGAKEATAKLLQEALTQSIQSIQKITSNSLAETHALTQRARKFSWFAVLSSVSISVAFGLFFITIY